MGSDVIYLSSFEEHLIFLKANLDRRDEEGVVILTPETTLIKGN